MRRADQSSRGVLPTVVRRCMWSRNFVNEEALVHWGLSRRKKTKNQNIQYLCFFHPRFSKHHAPHPAFRDLFTCNSEECLKQRSISWDSSSLKKPRSFVPSVRIYFHALLLHFVCWLAFLLSKSNINPIGRPVDTVPSTKRIILLCVSWKSTLQISWKQTIRT